MCRGRWEVAHWCCTGAAVVLHWCISRKMSFHVDKENGRLAFKPAQWCCVSLLYIDETLWIVSCAEGGVSFLVQVKVEGGTLVLHWCISRKVEFHVGKEKGGMAFKPAQRCCVALLYIDGLSVDCFVCRRMRKVVWRSSWHTGVAPLLHWCILWELGGSSHVKKDRRGDLA